MFVRFKFRCSCSLPPHLSCSFPAPLHVLFPFHVSVAFADPCHVSLYLVSLFMFLSLLRFTCSCALFVFIFAFLVFCLRLTFLLFYCLVLSRMFFHMFRVFVDIIIRSVRMFVYVISVRYDSLFSCFVVLCWSVSFRLGSFRFGSFRLFPVSCSLIIVAFRLLIVSFRCRFCVFYVVSLSCCSSVRWYSF